MSKTKPVEDKRVPLNCLIAPTTRRALDRLSGYDGSSFGALVDRGVAALEVQIAQGRVESVPAIEEKIKANVTPRQNRMRGKGDKIR